MMQVDVTKHFSLSEACAREEAEDREIDRSQYFSLGSRLFGSDTQYYSLLLLRLCWNMKMDDFFSLSCLSLSSLDQHYFLGCVTSNL